MRMGMWYRAFLPAIVLVALAGVILAKDEPEKVKEFMLEGEDVVIPTEDGWKLSGTYRAADTEDAPTIILVHMLDRERSDWTPFLERKELSAYHQLAYDMRGHGKSVRTEGETPTWESFEMEDWQAAEDDILVVRDWLVKEKGADPKRIALVGGSIGANLCLRVLARDETFPGAVLLAPGLNFSGVKTEKALKKCRPSQRIAIFAAGNDNPAGTAFVPQMEEMVAAMDAGARASYSFKIFQGTGGRPHGTDMLTGRKDLKRGIYNTKMRVDECPPAMIEALEEIFSGKKAPPLKKKERDTVEEMETEEEE